MFRIGDLGSEFKVEGEGFGGLGARFKVWGFGLGVGCEVQSLGVLGSGRVWGVGLDVQGEEGRVEERHGLEGEV